MSETIYWGDQIADQLIARRTDKTFVLNTGCTPSGPPHVGTLRDFATVEVVRRVLVERKIAHEVLTFIDDLDPLRTISKFLDASYYTPFKYQPLCEIPRQNDTVTYAEYFTRTTIEILHQILGYRSQVHLTSETYRRTPFPMFQFVERCLEHREALVETFSELKGKRVHPFFFLKLNCPSCNKLAQIEELDQSTKQAVVRCIDCDLQNQQLTPSTCKLSWRIEWVGKWVLYGVDFEPCGKDHGSSGGSLETGQLVIESIFGMPAPLSCVYEFIQTTKHELHHKSTKETDDSDDFRERVQQVGAHVLNYHLFVKRPSRHLIIDLDEPESLNDEFDEAIRRFHCGENEHNRALELVFLNEKIPSTVCSFASVRQALDLHQNVDQALEYLVRKHQIGPVDEPFLKERLECVRLHHQRSFKDDQISSKIKTSKEQEIVRFAYEMFKVQTTKDSSELLDEILMTLQTKFECSRKMIYQALYRALLGTDTGPRLHSILRELGREKLVERLKQSC